MSEASERRYDKGDVRGTIGAVIFTIVGLFVLWDSGHISDWSGSVFPRTVAVLMILLSILLIGRNLLGYASGEEKPLPGSVPRRVGLVAIMLLAALLMPYLGFLITGVAAYVGIMVVAMYERWTKSRLMLYPVVGVITVFAFHYLFDTVFLVPLPNARIFW